MVRPFFRCPVQGGQLHWYDQNPSLQALCLRQAVQFRQHLSSGAEAFRHPQPEGEAERCDEASQAGDKPDLGWANAEAEIVPVADEVVECAA